MLDETNNVFIDGIDPSAMVSDECPTSIPKRSNMSPEWMFTCVHQPPATAEKCVAWLSELNDYEWLCPIRVNVTPALAEALLLPSIWLTNSNLLSLISLLLPLKISSARL